MAGKITRRGMYPPPMEEKIKKILFLLPLLLGILACGAQPLPAQDVGQIVAATLTAAAQSNPTAPAPQAGITPAPLPGQPTAAPVSSLHYYWPTTRLEGFVVNPSESRASAAGFTLEFDNFPAGQVLRILGGEDAGQYAFCGGDSTPHLIRGFEGCYSPSTGGGFGVEWMEDGVPYSIGGMGMSQDLTLQVAEGLEALEIDVWRGRIK